VTRAATSPTSLDEAAALAARVLADDAPQFEVVAVRYGTRMTTRRDCFHDFEQLGEPDGPLGMDYFFWLLRNGTNTILVDVGFAGDVGARRGRTSVCAPLEALARLDVRPESVDLIVLTHLHYDHIGQLGAFPNAELVVQRRDLDFWQGPGSTGADAAHVERKEVDRVAAAVAAGRARVLDGTALVAPGVGAVLVGGHSPGQQAILVRGARSPVLLASDAVHYYEEVEGARQFAIFVDRDEMVRGYALLRALAESTGAALVPGHDPTVLERFPPVSAELAGVAVRLA
jgi:glyoxylase-like metal-dependent hydrolase (beta-lactamase superfamily II)